MNIATDRRPVLITCCIVILAVAPLVSPAAAQSGTDPAFIVSVKADGSAEVHVRSTFDLTTEAEREAFQTLVEDEEAQETARNRFLDRMREVARATENKTGREMHIHGARIDLQRTADEQTGIVTLSITWEGLAETEGNALVITEPFVSGFSTDRSVILVSPDGYEFVSATPEPDTREGPRAIWNAGANLSEFAVELRPDERPATDDSQVADDEPIRTDGQPGLGLATAGFAVAVSIGVMRRYGMV